MPAVGPGAGAALARGRVPPVPCTRAQGHPTCPARTESVKGQTTATPVPTPRCQLRSLLEAQSQRHGPCATPSRPPPPPTELTTRAGLAAVGICVAELTAVHSARHAVARGMVGAVRAGALLALGGAAWHAGKAAWSGVHSGEPVFSAGASPHCCCKPARPSAGPPGIRAPMSWTLHRMRATNPATSRRLLGSTASTGSTSLNQPCTHQLGAWHLAQVALASRV